MPTDLIHRIGTPLRRKRFIAPSPPLLKIAHGFSRGLGVRKIFKSHQGRKNFLPSLRDFLFLSNVKPSLERLGYFRHRHRRAIFVATR
ncbi:MAG: hypothetical protein ACREDQ_12515 [Limisphaerales bacterium]